MTRLRIHLDGKSLEIALTAPVSMVRSTDMTFSSKLTYPDEPTSSNESASSVRAISTNIIMRKEKDCRQSNKRKRELNITVTPTRLHVFNPIYPHLHACMRTRLHNSRPSMPTNRHTCLHASIPSCLHTYVFPYFHTSMRTCLHVGIYACKWSSRS